MSKTRNQLISMLQHMKQGNNNNAIKHIKYEDIDAICDYLAEDISVINKEHFILNNLEYEILKYCNQREYKWICRDKDGYIFVYEIKPHKTYDSWIDRGTETCIMLFKDTFCFIKWGDEPLLVNKILNSCEVIEDGEA